MPVQPNRAKRRQVSVFVSASESDPEYYQQREQTEAHVQAVKAGEREKCRGEKIQADGHTALIQTPVLHSLTDDENSSENNRCSQPCFHFPLFVCSQSGLGAPDCKTAREQADAEDSCLEHIQLLRARPALRCRVIKEIC